MPALDGIRALAVMAVVTNHAGVPGMSGGFIGVDVFFVLSGFLITSLLLAEHQATGRVALAAFWARRARRLLPALLVMVLAVSAARALFAPDSVAGLRADALAALLWVANWRFQQAGTDYFAQGGTPSPLQHTWSLGVEEQFYLVWPLLLVAIAVLVARRATRTSSAGTAQRRRFAVARVALVGAGASAVLAVALATPTGLNRVYFGSDTRAQALLLGAAMAAILLPVWPSVAAGRGRPLRPLAQRLAATVAAAGLMGLLAAAHWATGTAAAFRLGLLTGVAVAAAALIAGVMLHPHGLLGRALSIRPLVALGRISYGVYLWHWPTLLVLDGTRTGLSGLSLLSVRLAATLALATASWWLIERPVRRLPAVPARLLPAAALTVLAATAAVVVAVPVGLAPGAATSATSDLPPGVSAAAATAPVPSRAPRAVAPATAGAVSPAADPNRPLTVSVFGDSIAWTMMRYLPATPGITMIDHTVLGCGIVQGGPYRYFGQVSPQPPQCDSWPTTWAAQVKADHPDLVLLLVGRWETMDRVYNGQWTHIGVPAFDSYLSSQLNKAISVLSSTGARVVVSNEPYNRRGEQPNGSLYPEDQPARVNAWNALVTQAVTARPTTTRLLNLNQKLCPNGVFTWNVDGIQVRSDGVHLTPQGVDWLTPWLTSALRADAA